MMNLPESTPPATGLPADNTGASVASKLNSAASASALNLSLVAPGALICVDRAELQAHWYQRIPSYAAVAEWHAFLKYLAASPMRPALN